MEYSGSHRLHITDRIIFICSRFNGAFRINHINAINTHTKKPKPWDICQPISWVWLLCLLESPTFDVTVYGAMFSRYMINLLNLWLYLDVSRILWQIIVSAYLRCNFSGSSDKIWLTPITDSIELDCSTGKSSLWQASGHLSSALVSESISASTWPNKKKQNISHQTSMCSQSRKKNSESVQPGLMTVNKCR